MTVVTTRPDGTEGGVNHTVVGAASAHEALSDDSDSSYVDLTIPPNGQAFLALFFDEPTIPAGVKVKSIALRSRTRKVGSNQPVFIHTINYEIDGRPYSEAAMAAIGWSTITTFTPVPATALADSPESLEFSLHGQVHPGQGRFFELWMDTVYVDQPETSVDAPSGTISEDTNPPVQWTNTLDPDGGPQTRAEVRIFNDAQYGAGGFDPATSAAFTEGSVEGSGTSWEPEDTLPDDSYRAYVRVCQTVNGEEWWSDWTYGEFTIDVLRPAVPSVAAAGEDEDGRNRVDIAGDVGDVATTYLRLQRSYDGGVTWADVAGLDGGKIDGSSATVYDYEAPNGVTALYRARAGHVFAGGDTSFSDWSDVDSATWTSARWWLKHPGFPSLNFQATARSQPSRVKAARRGVHSVLGRPNPVPVYDTRASATGELVLRLESDTERAALEAILQDGAPLLIQAPPDTEAWPELGRWCAIGDLDGSRALDAAWGRYTFEGFDWEEVDRPDGDNVNTATTGEVFFL